MWQLPAVLFFAGKIIDILSVTLPIIACNGGILISTDFKDVIWENPIDKVQLNKLFRYLFDQKADFVAYTNDMFYYAQSSVYVSMFREYNMTVPAFRQVPLCEYSHTDLEKPAFVMIKILLYDPTLEQTQYIKGIPGLAVLSSENNYLDIMQEGSTKGNAVRALGEYLHIPAENIAVFGDNENDVSMFNCGALSI